jgi:hypothetical protein
MACTGHLRSNLYLMNMQIASSKTTCAIYPEPHLQGDNKTEYALTVCASVHKTTSAMRLRCPGHPHTDEGFASVVPLLTSIKDSPSHHVLHITPVDHDFKGPDMHKNDSDIVISVHTGLSLTPLAARGRVGCALATRLHREQPDG